MPLPAARIQHGVRLEILHPSRKEPVKLNRSAKLRVPAAGKTTVPRRRSKHKILEGNNPVRLVNKPVRPHSNPDRENKEKRNNPVRDSNPVKGNHPTGGKRGKEQEPVNRPRQPLKIPGRTNVPHSNRPNRPATIAARVRNEARSPVLPPARESFLSAKD